MEKIILSTPRLEIFPLTYQQLTNYLFQKDLFDREIGPTSRSILTANLRRAIDMKLSKLKESQLDQHPWITYWLIKLAPDGFGAGMLGFKGAPNAEGEVELGYGIDPDFRNKGYVSEAAARLVQWAFEDPRCTRIIAPDTPRSNLASNRVLEKIGMRIYSESKGTISWSLEKEAEQRE